MKYPSTIYDMLRVRTVSKKKRHVRSPMFNSILNILEDVPVAKTIFARIPIKRLPRRNFQLFVEKASSNLDKASTPFWKMFL